MPTLAIANEYSDSVPHQRLIQKLASYGFSGKLLLWLKGFLSDRYQRVVLNGSFSGWCAVTSGVPQGSVLGPLLFTLYINDIPNIVHTNLSFFADDSKVYSVIKSSEDSHQLLNLLKCKIMHVGILQLLERTNHVMIWESVFS